MATVPELDEEDDMLDKLTLATFSSYVGEAFTVVIDDQPVTAVLLEASALPNAPTNQNPDTEQGREPFSLVFCIPIQAPQRMYQVEHASLGEVGQLFLVPIGEDEQGWRYQAIFN